MMWIKEGNAPQEVKKNRARLFLLCFVCSLVLQLVYGELDTRRVLERKGTEIYKSVERAGGYEQEGDWIFKELPESVSAVYLKLNKEVDRSTSMTIRFREDNGEIQEKVANLLISEDSCYIPIPLEDCQEFMVTTLEEREIVEIAFSQEAPSLLEWHLSKISLLGTLGCLSLLWIFFLWAEKKPQMAKNLIPFYLFGGGLLYYFLQQTLTGDDSTMFWEQRAMYSLWDYIIIRYQTWCSRTVIEIVLYYIVHYFHLWAVLNTLACLLLCWCFEEILEDSAWKYHWFIVLSVSLYPMKEMNSAGWIASTTNYLWPLASVLFLLVLLKKVMFGQEISRLFMCVATIALFYASSQEQSAALVFGFFLVFTVYIYAQNHVVLKKLQLECEAVRPSRNREKWVPIIAVFSLFALLYHLLSPGNQLRALDQIFFFPELELISIWETIRIGVNSTLYEFYFRYSFVFFLFFMLIAALAYVKNNKLAFRIIGLLPCFVLLLGFNMSPELYSLMVAPSHLRGDTALIVAHGWSVLIDVTLYCCFILIPISVFFLVERKKAMLYILILGAGFLSRIVVAFSPTLWVSSNRTFIYMFFSVIIVMLFLLKELLEKTGEKTRLCCGVLLAVSSCFTVVQFY